MFPLVQESPLVRESPPVRESPLVRESFLAPSSLKTPRAAGFTLREHPRPGAPGKPAAHFNAHP
jgi:hypothetical protein